MRYRVVRGKAKEGGKLYGRGCEAGDIIETTKDLCAMFNSPGSIKFEPLEGGSVLGNPTSVKEPEVDDEFSTATVEELRKIAQDLDVDLRGATKKVDIIAILRKATAQ